MKYVPKHDSENFNVQDSSPLKDFFVLLGSATALIVVIVVAAGWIGEFVAIRLDRSLEEKLFPQSAQKLFFKGHVEKWEELDRVVHKLSPNQKFQTFVICDETANAFAIPGYQIGVTSGLLRMLKTENGLAMVLAHEIGHFQGRHHLLGLGRAFMVSLTLGLMGFSTDSFYLPTLGQNLVARTYGREHESEADRTAVNLMIKTYGHLKGSDEFFAGLLDEEDKEIQRKIPEFLSTHPLTKDRYTYIQDEMAKYKNGEVLPLQAVPSLCVNQ